MQGALANVFDDDSCSRLGLKLFQHVFGVFDEEAPTRASSLRASVVDGLGDWRLGRSTRCGRRVLVVKVVDEADTMTHSSSSSSTPESEPSEKL